MKLNFNIGYRTNWGETVCVTSSVPELGRGDASKALKLTLNGSETWSGSVTLPDNTTSLTYHYIVVREDGQIKSEWGHGNTLTFKEGIYETSVHDRWQDQPFDKPFYSSAFTNCINKHSECSTETLPGV